MWVVVWHQDFHNRIESIHLTKRGARIKQTNMNNAFYDIGKCVLYKVRPWNYKKFKDKITSISFLP